MTVKQDQYNPHIHSVELSGGHKGLFEFGHNGSSSKDIHASRGLFVGCGDLGAKCGKVFGIISYADAALVAEEILRQCREFEEAVKAQAKEDYLAARPHLSQDEAIRILNSGGLLEPVDYRHGPNPERFYYQKGDDGITRTVRAGDYGPIISINGPEAKGLFKTYGKWVIWED